MNFFKDNKSVYNGVEMKHTGNFNAWVWSFILVLIPWLIIKWIWNIVTKDNTTDPLHKDYQREKVVPFPEIPKNK